MTDDEALNAHTGRAVLLEMQYLSTKVSQLREHSIWLEQRVEKLIDENANLRVRLRAVVRVAVTTILIIIVSAMFVLSVGCASVPKRHCYTDECGVTCCNHDGKVCPYCPSGIVIPTIVEGDI